MEFKYTCFCIFYIEFNTSQPWNLWILFPISIFIYTMGSYNSFFSYNGKFNDFFIRHIINMDRAKIRQTFFWTDTGKFRDRNFYIIITVIILIVNNNETACIWCFHHKKKASTDARQKVMLSLNILV